MVKSTEAGSVVPPFLKKCYEMVDDEASDAIISWNLSNDSFVIRDTTEFSHQLLPKYFKHNNFSSFMRQLNIYGFRKIDTDHWEFANELFIRGQKHLLKNIRRRKQLQGQDKQKSSHQRDKSAGACEEIEASKLWNDVEILKTDRNALTQQLVKLRQHQETAESKLLVLRERLQGMEKNQQQMLSFLVMAMQSPEFLVQFMQPKEKNWRMAEVGKNMLERRAENGEPAASDVMIVRYQPPMDETPKPLPIPTSNSEKSLESDGMIVRYQPPMDETAKPLLMAKSNSEKSLESDFFMNIDFMKILMDGNMGSSEHQEPLILPDLPDDDILDQLLLENFADAKLDNQQAPIDSGMVMDPTVNQTQLDEPQHFELLNLEQKMPLKRMEKPYELEVESTLHGTQFEKSQHSELLTEQMGQ